MIEGPIERKIPDRGSDIFSLLGKGYNICIYVISLTKENISAKSLATAACGFTI